VIADPPLSVGAVHDNRAVDDVTKLDDNAVGTSGTVVNVTTV
jgi:hypothetical protein